jgi:enterochelin esterase family protein
MLALADLARAGDAAALESAVKALRGRVPLVEPDPRDAHRRVVTFLHWADEDVRLVVLPQLRFGTVPYAQDAEPRSLAPPRSVQTPFRRLWGSRLWYLRLNLPDTTLLGYTIGVERMPRGEHANSRPLAADEFLDPLNPETMGTRGDVSILRLPGAPDERWLVEHADIPKGRLEKASIESAALRDTRHFTVYVPAAYDTLREPARLVVVFDGDYFSADLRTPTVLDNLLNERRIPPTVAVFVDGQPTRDRDYVNSPDFADFVAKELQPWVTAHYRVSRDPRDSVLAGASFGGLAAAFTGLRHPSVFGKVLSLSGAFWPPPGWSPTMPAWQVLESDSELVGAYARATRQPLVFYMDCGLYEPAMLTSNRRLRDVLLAKGYPLTYVERPGSHSGLSWRHSIADGLIALFSSQQR